MRLHIGPWDGGRRSQGCASAMMARHATQPGPHAHHCSDHRNNSQKVLHFVSLEDPGSHGAQGQISITMQEEVTRGALPSHRLLRNSTRPQVHQPTRREASFPVTGYSGLLLHPPLHHHWSWEARRQLLLSTKRYPQSLQFLNVPVTGLDCPVWAVRAGQNFSYILEGPGTTNWSVPRDRNLDTHIHTHEQEGEKCCARDGIIYTT